MTGVVMQIYKVLDNDVGNKHEQHNAKHERGKSSYADHLINLRNLFVAPDSAPLRRPGTCQSLPVMIRIQIWNRYCRQFSSC